LPLARQAEDLGISRASLDDHPPLVSAADLALLRRMDELHLEVLSTGSAGASSRGGCP
jgi:putative transposase